MIALRYASICSVGQWEISVDWADRFRSFRSLVRVDHVRGSDVVVIVVVDVANWRVELQPSSLATAVV